MAVASILYSPVRKSYATATLLILLGHLVTGTFVPSGNRLIFRVRGDPVSLSPMKNSSVSFGIGILFTRAAFLTVRITSFALFSFSEVGACLALFLGFGSCVSEIWTSEPLSFALFFGFGSSTTSITIFCLSGLLSSVFLSLDSDGLFFGSVFC